MMRFLVASCAVFLTSFCAGQQLDSVCIVTVTYAEDTSKADTTSITYYGEDGLEREEFTWFRRETSPVHYTYTYDRHGRLKIQETHFHGLDRYRFRYKHGRLYSVTDFETDKRGRTEKTGVTIWEYDDHGRIIRISNPAKWYSDYTRTYTYDSLGRDHEQINLDEYGKEVYRCRTYYNVEDVGPLLTLLDTARLSVIKVENHDAQGRLVERYELKKGKINSHSRNVYDENGLLRTTISSSSTAHYAYGRLPRRSAMR